MGNQDQTPNVERLFERLCSLELLDAGYRTVRKNKGAPGIDGVMTEDFGKDLARELEQLKKELESWTYRPRPVRAVEIPKPQGGTRQLGIPCVRDRVVQAALKALLEPIFEPLFSEHSYGFRPGRNQAQAVEAAERYVRRGKIFVVDIDLAKFFDRIHHDRLIGRLGRVIRDKRILRVIGLTLRSGVMKDGCVSASREGSVQGSPLSPLLSNVVLDELDKEIERRGLPFCRFADDCNIYVRTLVEAERAMRDVSQFIEEKLKLVINREKSKTALCNEVKFLGMTITLRGERSISRESMRRAAKKVIELTPRRTHLPWEKSIEQINRWYVGWSNYYSMSRFPSQLEIIEAHTRRRLRARIIRQAKRPRHLATKLIGLGLPEGAAYRAAYCGRGPWALSVHGSIEKTLTNHWFAQQGLKSTTTKPRLPHWKPIWCLPKLR